MWRCGRTMKVNYINRRRWVRYVRNGGQRQSGNGPCQSFGAGHVEAAFEGLLLEALQ